MNLRFVLSGALVLAGLVLIVFLGDQRFFWFQGRPLGILLIVLGGIDVAENVVRRRRSVGGHTEQSGPAREADDHAEQQHHENR